MPEKKEEAPIKADDTMSKTDEDQRADSEPATSEDVEGIEKEPEAHNTDTDPAKDSENIDGKDKDIEPEKAAEDQKMPKGIYFLLGNEFCERFSFYGMRGSLTLFLHHQLLYSEAGASEIFHGFLTLSHLTPILGAILSDSWLGKFRTIFYVSIFYAIGNIIISVGAIPHPLQTMKAMSLIGLFIISLGTGGIKTCVVSFGGDQFKKGQEEKRKYFFSLFYFAINLGSFLSTVITPVLRAHVKCFGQDTCYPLAFFVPAVLFAIALVLLIIGKPFYVIKPAKGSVFVSVFKCIGYALFRKVTVKGERREHWLEYAEDKYDKDLIYDIKCLLNVLFVFIPLPAFWALYDQQGSKWILQGSKMDGKVFGYYIKPDQMHIINPLLILILVPVFDNFIYPLYSKCNICIKPLQRMVIGGLLSAFSFVIAALVEMSIETEVPAKPPEGYSDMTIINNSPCNLDIQREGFNISLKKFGNGRAKENKLSKFTEWRFTPTGCGVETWGTVTQELSATDIYETMMITVEENVLTVQVSNDSKIKDKKGNPRVRLLFALDYEFTESVNATFFLQGPGDLYIIPDNMTRPGKTGMTDYCTIKPGQYKLYLPSDKGSKKHEEIPFGDIYLKQGGSYILYIYESKLENQKELHYVIAMLPNSLHILWQIPQAIIITAGEVMFSITGVSFSYSQAPASLKAIVQAAWLLTNAVGNLFVVLLVHYIDFEKQSYSFIMFSVLMALSMGVFGIMGHYYKYVKKRDDSEDYD